MERRYNPRKWYWEVADQSLPTNIYDSENGLYVDSSDVGYQAFISDTDVNTGNPLKATKIISDAELQDVLKFAGVPYMGTVAAREIQQPRVVEARCRLTLTGQTIPSATPTAIIWDVENKDPLAFHDPGLNPERIIPTQSGLYLVLGRVRVLESTAGAGGTPNSGMRAAQIRKGIGGGASDEGTTRIGASPSGNTEFPVIEYVQFNSGDILRLFVEQNCGGDIDIQARMNLFRIE